MFASKMAQRALIYRPFSSARTVSRHLGVLNTSTSRWQSSSAARESNLEEVVEQHNDHIKTAVKELLQNKESSSKAITFEQLQQSHQNFEHLLKEARLCIADCEESRLLDGRVCLDESTQASEAVEDAYAAYLDMLDDFRGCHEEDLTSQFGNVRDGSATELKMLRKELDKILQEAHDAA